MSSVFGNASYSPRVRALKSSHLFSTNTFSQESICALQKSRLQYPVLHVRHESTLRNDQSTSLKHVSRHENHHLGHHHESKAWWQRLRQQARDTFISDNGVELTQSALNTAHNVVTQDAVSEQIDDEAPHFGDKSRSREGTQRRKQLFTNTLRRNMLHFTLYRSFPHLNYENPSPHPLDAHERYFLESNSTKKIVSLPGILQLYLATSGPQNSYGNVLGGNFAGKADNAIGHVFDAKTLQFLSQKGYSPNDVMVWAWILTAKESYRAALRLFVWETQDPSRRRVPLFVVKLLLHRASLDIKAFRVLLKYSVSRMNQQPLGTIPSVTPSEPYGYEDTSSPSLLDTPMDAQRANSLVMLLLRKARQLWPAAQLNIAHSFAFFLIHKIPLSHTYRAAYKNINALRAHHFNECLRALAIPSRHGPFVSASIQQQAQFELLKAMATHEPVLPVSRKGYQAVVAVQLAHKKTFAERIYSAQKSPSWPPWKEARMGIDTHRGNEGMKSRTMQVLSQMKAAGYSHSVWEKVAAILGGWDTDGSPTIQTRSLAISPKLLKDQLDRQKKDSVIWAVRIRATRTLREAWACFLSYQNLYPVPSERIYHAMAKKIIYSGAIRDDKPNDKVGPLPGDGLEVFPEPSSARDVIYVHTDPPSLEELLKQMVSQGIRPGDNFISLLLRTCSNFSTGLKYASAFLNPKQTRALCAIHPGSHDQEAIEILKVMNTRLFDSFIVFLCSHANFDDPGHRLRKEDAFPILMRTSSTSTRSTLISHKFSFSGENKAYHPRALAHAVQLLKILLPRRVSAWLPLLKALASPRGLTSERYLKRDRQWFLAWYEIIEVLRWLADLEVEPGMDGLTILCQVFSRGVSAGLRDATAAEEGLLLASKAKEHNELCYDVAATFEDFVYDGIRLLKSYFDRLVYPKPIFMSAEPGNSTNDKGTALIGKPLPDMLQVPSPATLHALVRALGIAEDNDGILNLLQWMSRSASELKERASQAGNGEKMMRRTLTAVRIFLEGQYGEHAVHWDPELIPEGKLSGQAYAGHRNAAENADSRPTFSDGHVEEAYKIIEATDGWGSWPSDEEVRAYYSWQSGPNV